MIRDGAAAKDRNVHTVPICGEMADGIEAISKREIAPRKYPKLSKDFG